VGVQHRLAEYFRHLAEAADDRANPDAWAAYVESLPDDNEHVRAIARAQAKFGDPAAFTPTCDNGLHLRTVAPRPPTEHLLRYLASLEGRAAPWVYGDWAVQAPPPERDGVPQWTVDVDVMVRGGTWDWPPRFEHPNAEPISDYGQGEVWPTYEEHHLTARLELWVTSEPAALELTRRLIGEHLDRDDVIAHRVRARPTPGEWEAKPRRPEDLIGGVYPVRWQRADVDGATVTIAWRGSGESIEGVSVDEQPDQVIITVRKRFGPIWTMDGIRIGVARPGRLRLGTARVELAQPLGKRHLIDGATSRAPDDLSIWQHQAKQTRAQILAARLPP
jgi:hypothetical protein